MFSFLNPYRWLLYGGLVLAIVGGGAVLVHRHDEAQQAIGRAEQLAVDQAAINKQKREADTLLASETAKTKAAEDGLRNFKDQQELKDANNRKTVAGLERRLADAAADHGGSLRDPNAAGCGPSGSGAKGADSASASDRPADAAGTGGLLSVQLSDLLRARLRRADEINDAYASCRDDAMHLRATMPP
jgi:hypothetical protein